MKKIVKLLVIVFLISITISCSSFENVIDEDNDNISWYFDSFTIVNKEGVIEQDSIRSLIFYKESRKKIVLDVNYNYKRSKVGYYSVIPNTYLRHADRVSIKAFDLNRNIIYIFNFYKDGTLTMNKPGSEMITYFTLNGE